jgi:hypothetical protein
MAKEELPEIAIPTAKEELPEIAGKFVGEMIFLGVLICFRGYLLMLCASWLVPFLVLPFWQWAVIGLTIRIMIAPPLASK